MFFHVLAIWPSFGICVLVCPCASFLVRFFSPPGEGLHRAQRGMEAPEKGPQKEVARKDPEGYSGKKKDHIRSQHIEYDQINRSNARRNAR